MLLALAPSGAQGALTIASSVGGAPTAAGVVRDNLDWLSLGMAGGTNAASGVTVTLFGNAATVTGSVSGRYAAPFLSGNNGAGFGAGGTTQANGVDTTRYLSSGSTGAVGGSRVEIALPTAASYFGLLWGSVDGYNTLAFYDGATLVGTLTGSAVTPQATGNQGSQGTFYVNILSDLAFDRVVATSSSFAFEFDNIAFSAATPIPAPAAFGLFAMGLLGLAWARRRARAARPMPGGQ
ncbi:hypothetical protein [Elioraea sp.]|uniref:Npun_F0296 family exosortase-dependent surface protein n=1 Tax=Elioraea sp. TaxID=2185103 RepID=UPI0025BC0775|nr:hypothetical protein [Elioraea sp.]